MSEIDLVKIIAASGKKTPVKAYVKCSIPINFDSVQNFGERDKVLFGEYSEISYLILKNKEHITDYKIEFCCKNSAVPLIDYTNIYARIEPGAIIREGAVIHNNAVVLMGACINTGAVIGSETMIDMNAVIGGGAIVGRNCHIGAGAVLAGMVEPACKVPVVIEDNVFIGANAVICEGVTVGQNSAVGAGAVVLSDIPPDSVAVGVPAKVIGKNSGQKTKTEKQLRNL